jgi:hypothetical protein
MLVRLAIVPTALVGFLISTGCEKRCDEAADPHARYDVTVLDFYNAQGKFKYGVAGGSYPLSSGTCSSWDGLGPGASLQLQAAGQQSNSDGTCYEVTADLTSAPPGLTLLGPSTDGNALNQIRSTDAAMYALEDVAAGQCAGVLVLGFSDGLNPGGIYAQPVAGDFPPAILYTLFLPSSGTCPCCLDNFAIQLTKE